MPPWVPLGLAYDAWGYPISSGLQTVLVFCWLNLKISLYDLSWQDCIQLFLVGLYGLDIIGLGIYGFYALIQTLVFWVYRSQNITAPIQYFEYQGSEHQGSEPDSFTLAHECPLGYPTVTIQLPIYNERHVVLRLIEAVMALDWPASQLHIQILDDSTDDTTELIQAILAQQWGSNRQAEMKIEHLHRRDRTGFKAGALQQGLATAMGEFIAIFDADFVPAPDFLQRMMPGFSDQTIGCVQARWGHLNPDTSLLTRAQALGIDGHFVVEQQVRDYLGACLNFNGTAGIWRRTALEQGGGWQGDTLTEDLDLSYRIQLQGWTIAYHPQVVVPAELPVQLDALKRQQFRWAKGSIQTALKLLVPLWRSPLPSWRKLLGSLHLTQYVVHPLMVLNLLLIFPVSLGQSSMLAAMGSTVGLGHWLPALITLSALGPPLLYWVTLGEATVGWAKRLAGLGLLLIVGMGLSINNSRAVLEAILGIPSDFQRTPKFAVLDRLTPWQRSDYVLRGNLLVGAEVWLGLYALGLGYWVWRAGLWWVLPWVGLYAGGYGFFVGLTLVQTWQHQQTERDPSELDAAHSPPQPLGDRPHHPDPNPYPS